MGKSGAENSIFLNIKQVMASTGLSYNTVYQLFKCGSIPGTFKLGKKWMVSLEDYTKYTVKLRSQYASKSATNFR